MRCTPPRQLLETNMFGALARPNQNRGYGQFQADFEVSSVAVNQQGSSLAIDIPFAWRIELSAHALDKVAITRANRVGACLLGIDNATVCIVAFEGNQVIPVVVSRKEEQFAIGRIFASDVCPACSSECFLRLASVSPGTAADGLMVRCPST